MTALDDDEITFTPAPTNTKHLAVYYTYDPKQRDEIIDDRAKNAFEITVSPVVLLPVSKINGQVEVLDYRYLSGPDSDDHWKLYTSGFLFADGSFVSNCDTRPIGVFLHELMEHAFEQGRMYAHDKESDEE